MLWEFFIIIGLIALVFASITDLKTREVPNWLSYSLIAIGLGGRLIYSLVNNDKSIFIYGLIGFGIFFIFANIMYFTKQWGGGDAKLLMGLGALFGNYETISYLQPNLDFYFIGILLMNIFLAGTIYGILYSFYLATIRYKEFNKELKKENYKLFIIIFSIGILFLIIGLFSNQVISKLFILLGLMIMAFITLYQFLRIVQKSCMNKEVNVNKLTEGDWIAYDIKIGKKIVYSPNKENIISKKKYEKARRNWESKLKFFPKLIRETILNLITNKDNGLTKEDIQAIKKYKIKKVTVRDGIPFVPAFLFGFIITIVCGNIFTVLKAFF